MSQKSQPERVYHYTIDREGRLWIEGTELTDPQVLKFFMRKMEKLPDGNYRVLCMGELNLIEAEDVPYVVQSIQIKKDKIKLNFPGGYQESLEPNTLEVGNENVLYCRVREGQFTARFNRKPYMELTRHIEKDKTLGYVLNWRGQKYPIGGVVERSSS